MKDGYERTISAIAYRSFLITRSERGFSRLGLERAAAAAGLHCVRIVELEATGFEAFIEVDGGAIEVQGALLVDDDGHAMVLVLGIDFLVIGLVETKGIGKAAAAAARDADPQDHIGLDFLIGNDPLDFIGCFFGEDDAHEKLR